MDSSAAYTQGRESYEVQRRPLSPETLRQYPPQEAQEFVEGYLDSAFDEIFDEFKKAVKSFSYEERAPIIDQIKMVIAIAQIKRR